MQYYQPSNHHYTNNLQTHDHNILKQSIELANKNDNDLSQIPQQQKLENILETIQYDKINATFKEKIRRFYDDFKTHVVNLGEENTELKQMLKSLYTLHTNNPSNKNQHSGSSNKNTEQQIKELQDEIKGIKIQCKQELVQVRDTYGSQVKKLEQELISSVGELRKVKEKNRTKFQQLQDDNKQLKLLVSQYEEKLGNESSKIFQNAEIAQKIIISLKNDNKNLSNRLKTQELYLKSLFSKEQSSMLEKLREENDMIYSDVTQKIAGIKSSYEGKIKLMRENYEIKLKNMAEDITDYKEMNREFESVAEILKHKGLQIKKLKIKIEILNEKLQEQEELILEKDEIIKAQSREIKHTKGVLVSRITELEGVLNSHRFQKNVKDKSKMANNRRVNKTQYDQSMEYQDAEYSEDNNVKQETGNEDDTEQSNDSLLIGRNKVSSRRQTSSKRKEVYMNEQDFPSFGNRFLGKISRNSLNNSNEIKEHKGNNKVIRSSHTDLKLSLFDIPEQKTTYDERSNGNKENSESQYFEKNNKSSKNPQDNVEQYDSVGLSQAPVYKAVLHGMSLIKDDKELQEDKVKQSAIEFIKKSKVEEQNSELQSQIQARNDKIAALDKKLKFIQSRDHNYIDKNKTHHEQDLKQSSSTENSRFRADLKNIEMKFKQLNIEADSLNNSNIINTNKQIKFTPDINLDF